MNKILYYFNVFITHNNQVTDIHLSKLLDSIRKEDVEKRLKHLKNQGNICLMQMEDPQENTNDANDRKVVVGKFRMDKPYISTLGTDRIDEIPDDVVELTSFFYRRNSRLLIMEYNHYGVRSNALQRYLSSFLPNSNENKWSVVLEPIEPNLGFDDISKSKDIKNIVFKIDLTSRQRQIYNAQNASNEHRSVIGNVLTNSIEAHSEFGANFATVGFSNGVKWRQNVIEPEDLISVLRSLDLDSDTFESIRVTYESPSTGRKEELDLKNQGVLKDLISINGNEGWEDICNSIEAHFYNRGRLGDKNYLSYNIEKEVNLPALIYNEK